jgi:hypothetical protein
VSTPAEFIARAFAVRTAAHLAHLQSRSYAEHVALGGFYDSLVWARYAWAATTATHKFVSQKADKCDRFVRGEQWEQADIDELKRYKKPPADDQQDHLDDQNVMGEQIFNRTEISFRPRSGARPETADVLTKVFKQISDNNQLDWKRSDMFADGIITQPRVPGRAHRLQRLMQGEVRIENLNPKNVVIDPDAEDYDPDTWSDVSITKWMTADDIAVLYNKEDAELPAQPRAELFPYGYDSIQTFRDRFGDRSTRCTRAATTDSSVRNIRVIERQYRSWTARSTS